MTIYADIDRERRRAHAKHGPSSMESMPVDAMLRYTILAEEVGEVAKEFNDAAGDRRRVDLDRLRTELVQVAAMAAAWADAIIALTPEQRAVDDDPWPGDPA
jgi:NTP pyrophosphatase (non-canonical NTP hydrolase)